MKAAPLLRAWVHRLRTAGVNFHHNHRWIGFTDDGSLRIENQSGELIIKSDATILALGGASWPQLGSTGTWASCLQDRGVDVARWQSANCGFEIPWSDHLREKFGGEPLKAVSLTFKDHDGITETRHGELLIKEYGVEGSLIYWFSKRLRETINAIGEATFYLDLLPDQSADKVSSKLARPRGSQSTSRYLQSCLGNNALKRTLLYEFASREQLGDPSALSKLIKALPITVRKTRPIAEAISSAGGVSFASLDDNLMIKALPGIFVAGEMLDWEAPTGGYLLTACVASGRWAGIGASHWLNC